MLQAHKLLRQKLTKEDNFNENRRIKKIGRARSSDLGAQTGGRTGGVFKTYVLAGDVTSAQAADAKINQRRQF